VRAIAAFFMHAAKNVRCVFAQARMRRCIAQRRY
jgi:hypothetical protein